MRRRWQRSCHRDPSPWTATTAVTALASEEERSLHHLNLAAAKLLSSKMEDATGLDERETPVDPECQPADEDKLRGPEDDDPDPDEPWPTAGPASRGSSAFSSGRDRAQPTVTQRGNSRGACAKKQAGDRRMSTSHHLFATPMSVRSLLNTIGAA